MFENWGSFHITHTYDSVGDYTVELTVTDNEGASDTESVEVEVNKESEELHAGILIPLCPPLCPRVAVGNELTLSSASTGDIISHEWDFKNVKDPGTATDSGVDGSYTYQKRGHIPWN